MRKKVREIKSFSGEASAAAWQSLEKYEDPLIPEPMGVLKFAEQLMGAGERIKTLSRRLKRSRANAGISPVGANWHQARVA